MKKKLYMYSMIMWIVLAVLMTANIFVRETRLNDALGTIKAGQVSTLTGILIILISTYIFIRQIRLEYEQRDLLLIGFMWLSLTAISEFLLSYFVLEKTAGSILMQYQFWKGELWSLILLSVLFAPWIADRIYSWRFKRR